MFKYVHLSFACLLLVFHIVFLARGFLIGVRGTRPKTLDRIARFAAQAALPAAIATGALLSSSIRSLPLAHGILGVLPVLAIPVARLIRRATKRMRSMPWALPVVNLVFISVAFATGLVSG